MCDPVIGRFMSNDPIAWTPSNPVMSFNRYLYVNNNPYKYKDPDGKFLQSLVGGLVGGVVNVALDYVSSGASLSVQEALGSFAGGADTGALVANGVPLAVANGLSSAAGEAVTQMANAASGQEASFGKVITSGEVGFVSAKIPSIRVPGITSGKGHMAASFKGQLTKMANGQTKNVTSKTVGNGIKSGLVGSLGQQVTKVAINAGAADNAAKVIDDSMGKCLPANPHC